MFDQDKHRTVMMRILRDIFDHQKLRNILAFKGGTMAMMFYGLPRMSVDLDFDLLEEESIKTVIENLDKILPKYGQIIERADKKYTIFYLIDYGFGDRKLKIEISKKKKETKYEVKNYMGIGMKVMNRAAMVACKLAAVVERTHEANRDLFDMWYFLKADLSIDRDLFKMETGLEVDEGWKKLLERVEKIKKNEILFGLGDLLDEKMKYQVREKMAEELKFEVQLKLKSV